MNRSKFDKKLVFSMLFSIWRFDGPKMAPRPSQEGSWGGLGPLLEPFGPSLGGLGAHFGPFGGVLGVVLVLDSLIRLTDSIY